MKQNKPKYKIIYQSRENVWGTRLYQKKFHTKKWLRMAKKLDRPAMTAFRTYRKPRSIKLMKKQRLLNKQKFKSFYGHLSYGYLKKIYQRVSQSHVCHTIDQLRINLEHRLDIFLFRSGLYESIFQARQAIRHKKIHVNQKILAQSNYKLQAGDFITIPTTVFKKTLTALPYSHINRQAGVIIFLRSPKELEIKYPFNFYNKYLSAYLDQH